MLSTAILLLSVEVLNKGTTVQIHVWLRYPWYILFKFLIPEVP